MVGKDADVAKSRKLLLEKYPYDLTGFKSR